MSTQPLTILQSSVLLATETIGMVTDAVSGTRNLTKSYAAGTAILLNHTEYYANVHDKHHATKQEQLNEEVSKLPDSTKALIDAAKAKHLTA